MNHEQIEQLREYLRKRIVQSEGWATAEFPTSAFIDYRVTLGDRLCQVVPHEWLDLNGPEIERKQSRGVRFRVTWQDPPQEAAFVDVLLASEWKADERAGTGPVVKVKAVDLRDGNRVSSKHDIISPPVRLDECNPRDKIDAFYREWLERAFNNDRKEKILSFVYPVDEI